MERAFSVARAGAAVLLVALGLSGGITRGAGFLWLGDLPGGKTASYANAISPDGLTVVGQSESASGMEGFRWTLATGMVGIGKPADIAGQVDTKVLDVSADGSVVVGSIGPLNSQSPSERAFRWSAETGFVRIGDLPNGSPRSTATGISDDGSVVVGYNGYAEGLSPPSQGFRWTAGEGTARLSSSTETRRGYARGISADGGVIVGAKPTGQSIQLTPVRWTDATGMVDLGTWSGTNLCVEASAVSADGSVIVGGDAFYVTGQAFRWTEETGMVRLGPSTADSRATAVSADGSIVVGEAGGLRTFIWDSSHGMRDLYDVLVKDLGVPKMSSGGPGAARGISADGKIIVGGSYTDAWIATLYETRPAVFQKVLNETTLPDGNDSIDSFGTVIVGADMSNRAYKIRNASPEMGTFRATTSGDVRVLSTPKYYPSTQFDLASDASILLNVELDTTKAGAKSGTVTVQSPDSPLDLAETFRFTGTVLDHANASFDPWSNNNGWTLDFGTVAQGQTLKSRTLPRITNLPAESRLTARLDLDSITGMGDTGVLTTNMAPFTNLEAGQSRSFDAFLDPSGLGDFWVNYQVLFSDEDLPGATGEKMSLWLMGKVRAGGDADADYDVDIYDVAFMQICYGQSSAQTGWAQGDFDGDHDVDIFDVAMMQVNYGTSSGPAPVPEPSAVVLAILGFAAVLGWGWGVKPSVARRSAA
ncbi:MAG: choice-of-anchor D domain-containing protein [Pirellulales bacterium]